MTNVLQKVRKCMKHFSDKIKFDSRSEVLSILLALEK